MRRVWRHYAEGAVAVCALAAAFPAATHAAGVSVVDGQLRYDGGSQVNRVVVTMPDPDTYQVADATAPVVAGPGCTAVGDRRATCSSEGVTGIALDLGAESDRAEIGSGVTLPVQLVGGDGADVLLGGPGADRLSGGPGDDELNGADGADAAFGGDGSDTFTEGSAANGPDSLNGGNGVDTASFASRSEPLTLQLDNISNDGQSGEGDDVRADVERVRGGSGPDVIIGGEVSNVLTGGSGADYLDGRGGVDEVSAGAGNDRIGSRDRSRDEIACGTGEDTIFRDGLDELTSDCDETFASAPMALEPVSTRLQGRRRLRLRVACELAAFGRCKGTVRVRTLRPVRTRSGRRRTVKLGRKTFDLAPGQEAVVRVRLSRSSARLIRRKPRRVLAVIRGGDEAGPTDAQAVFTVRR